MARPLAIAVAAGVLGGGVAAAGLVAGPMVAGAVAGSDRVTAVREALQGLVDDDTITDEQADKVADTLGKSEALRGGPGGPGGHFGFGAGREALGTLATALGMTEDDVRTALRDGTTVKELAERQGKDVAAVEKTLTDAANAKIDEAVAAGRIDADRAADLKTRVAEGVKQFVENGRPTFGKGFGGHGPRGENGERPAPGEPGTPPVPSPSTSPENSSYTT